MKQYNINHHLEARTAFEKKFTNLSSREPCAFFEGINNPIFVNAIENKQAWTIKDKFGNLWLQSYNTIVSVKWYDGNFERFGRWSNTTSRHQSYFEKHF